MNSRLALKLASRINALLLLELTQGVDAPRMLADPLYARDVLLVCDAYRGSELSALAQQFRAAVAAGEAKADAAPLLPRAGQTSHSGDHVENGHHDHRRRDHVAPDVRRDAVSDSRPDAKREQHAHDSKGSSASRFFSSLFGPMVPLDAPPDARAQPSRGWFGRNRGANK